MLADLPDGVTTYWLAFQRLQDPQQRDTLYWDHLYETDPDRFKREQAELMSQYKENSMAQAGR